MPDPDQHLKARTRNLTTARAEEALPASDDDFQKIDDDLQRVWESVLEEPESAAHDMTLEINPHKPLGNRSGEGIVGYMCKTEYEYELGYANGGSLIYETIEDLKTSRPCVEECGIVEVEVRLRRIV